jgi:hypothetical protein
MGNKEDLKKALYCPSIRYLFYAITHGENIILLMVATIKN